MRATRRVRRRICLVVRRLVAASVRRVAIRVRRCSTAAASPVEVLLLVLVGCWRRETRALVLLAGGAAALAVAARWALVLEAGAPVVDVGGATARRRGLTRIGIVGAVLRAGGGRGAARCNGAAPADIERVTRLGVSVDGAGVMVGACTLGAGGTLGTGCGGITLGSDCSVAFAGAVDRTTAWFRRMTLWVTSTS